VPLHPESRADDEANGEAMKRRRSGSDEDDEE
jgi:hypothetical protein